ncbi:glyceraldehyde-3-phosphate dehydrogenase GAPDH1 [Cardiosporidium cionae]|uniref:Glyceraldehyde-3-phosphate dehydrogenase GAPDH1 n=1 Tax=Cardiosporidium cionae TaxID=476202 RepID=A0ABQ7J7U6_9APIC|nr:glyceraldehyde-3-phosphate dehydrogenase GAPDH1 [Cardiosporidium cionae]|eukprot:KAF8820023.1 glyceraldehyde-3-phosphate dehydrogenase GAPDH1 [Cardiosporidium cionae]
MKLSVFRLFSLKHAVLLLFFFQLFADIQKSLSIPNAEIDSAIRFSAVERGVKTRKPANEKIAELGSSLIAEEDCSLFNSDERGCTALHDACQYNIHDGRCALKKDHALEATHTVAAGRAASALPPQQSVAAEHKSDVLEKENPEDAGSVLLSLLEASQGFLPAFNSKNALLKNSQMDQSYRSNIKFGGARSVAPTQLLRMSALPSSPMRVGINGFGRIGRLVFRLALSRPDIKIRHINCSMSPKYMAYLLKFDSVHGRFKGDIQTTDNSIIVNGDEITISSVRDPREIPWADSGVDYVCESTGAFCTTEDCMKHIDRENGASKVVISAPAKDAETPTLVMGVNAEKEYNPATMDVVSCASCTTNCLAPIVKVIDDAFGIEEGLMTTVHAATGTQKVVDSSSKKDWRGGRASSANIIPSSTGAAKAVARCMPSMAGKLTGMAFRVPTIDASVVDLTARLKQGTTYTAIKEAMKEAASTSMKGILAYTEEPVVSQDIVGEPYSAIFDAGAGIMLNPQFVKLVAWYDNEYGYANRLIDLLTLMNTRDVASNVVKKFEKSRATQTTAIPAL